MSTENDDQELLYSPSRWTKRYKTSEECMLSFVKNITAESEISRKDIPCMLDVPYGVLAKEKYDLFGIDLPSEAPIVFYLHGGYWQEESLGRSSSSYIAKVFHKHGIKSFIVGYELCPHVSLEEILEETENALKACLNYAKSKRSRGICLVGHSVGAHMVAHFFAKFVQNLSDEDLKLLRTSFMIGGLYNLTPLLSTSYNVNLKLTLETAKKFSVQEQEITKSDTEFFVVVGRNDTPAFVKQSEEFEKRLKLMNLTSHIIIYEDIDHFNVIENIKDEDFELTKLILTAVDDY